MTYKYRYSYIMAISIIAALGGFVFGYDWVVIGGAKPFYEAFFNLTDSSQIGWAMSNALVGAIIGTTISSYFTDKFGRKNALIFSGLLFTVSAIMTSLSQSFSFFVWARILGGVGIGLASTVSPMYIGEMAPAKHRGKLVSINQLTIVLGILVAQITNWLIAEPVPNDATLEYIRGTWNGELGWRWMFGAETIPAFTFFVLSLLIPESPRWLIKQNRDDEAQSILNKIGGQTYAENEIISIKDTLRNQTDKVRFDELLNPSILPILLLGIGLAVFTPWCGIDILLYYGEEIFQAAGYNITELLFNIVITGVVLLVFTLVAMKTVDNWGRKKLMLIGSGALVVIYLLLAFFYYHEIVGEHMLLLVVTAIAFYAMSIAPVTWVILSEIFPNRLRGAAMSVSVFAMHTASLISIYTFPILNNGLGEGTQGTAMAIGLYATVCLIGFILMWKYLPETKGRTLEELEKELTTL